MEDKQLYQSDLTHLSQQIKAWRESKEFFTPTHIDTPEMRDAMLGKLMLVVTEFAEAAEALRSNDRANFEEELADGIIRVLDITSAIGSDIGAVVRNKMLVNEKRPVKHGRSCNL